MEIIKKHTGNTLILELSGRLDTNTAPELEAAIEENIADVTDLQFDFKELQYLSSAGLRVLLVTQKAMKTRGKMLVRNPNTTIMEVFEVTGFTDILTIE